MHNGELVEQMDPSGDFTNQADLLETAYKMGDVKAFSFISSLSSIDMENPQIQSLVGLILEKDHANYLDILFNANGK